MTIMDIFIYIIGLNIIIIKMENPILKEYKAKVLKAIDDNLDCEWKEHFKYADGVYHDPICAKCTIKKELGLLK